jgi:AraC-like DNA-binding protein
MLFDSNVIAKIIESFAMATGVPAFIIDGEGNILLTTKGFSPKEYSFADLDALQCFFDSDKISTGKYYTLITEHQFLYNFVPIMGEGNTHTLLISGPVLFHPLTDRQITTLMRNNQISLRSKTEIAQKIAQLPQISMPRLAHLGRVLLSLCHAYCTEGIYVSSDNNLLPETDTGHSGAVPKITFTLVEEEKYSPFDLIQHVKRLMLTGDIAGIRALRDQNLVLPLNQVDERDEVLSAKYRVITVCSAWAGMVFDHQLPYEQVLMVLDQFTRRAHQTSSIPELTNMIFESIEAFAWLARKYSTRQYIKPVRQVIQYIQSDLTKKITLPDLAKLTGLSQSYLSRLIKKETGSSLVELIDSYRIEEGKYLLLNTDYSILRIAELTGFNYQYHFSLRFKKYTGMTPTHFRQTGGTRLN